MMRQIAAVLLLVFLAGCGVRGDLPNPPGSRYPRTYPAE